METGLNLSRYIAARRVAERLDDLGDYDLSNGEMNPAIYLRFAMELRINKFSTIWEPFSTPMGRGFRHLDCCGVALTAHGMASEDGRVLVKDSTVEGPQSPVGGVIFHPPYFGSALMSDDARDLSAVCSWDVYASLLKKAAGVVIKSLLPSGLVEAIGRSYRHGGKLIRMDLEMLRVFDGLELFDVWISEPDVVLVLRRP
jgi:hypothetical protein